LLSAIIYRCLYSVLPVLLLACVATAEEVSFTSDLIPVPSDLAIYERPYERLSRRNQWQVMIHGLRNAPLDPKVWGVRLVDRSENRQLVPMRPFFLRASEKPDFLVDKISLSFRFESVGRGRMRREPSLHTPMLEIGFSGNYQKGAPGEKAVQDASYAVRLTPSPLFESGVYYRSFSKYVLVQNFNELSLNTGKEHQVEIIFSPGEMTLMLDGSELAKLSGEDYREGLISLHTDWHPLKISEINIKGSLRQNGKVTEIIESGLLGNF